MFLKILYAANVLVAGWIGLTCVFNTRNAGQVVFSGAYSYHPLMSLIGALWLSIALCSVLGLFRPLMFTPVLAIQFIYKFLWLVVVALPALIQGQDFPRPMAIFFVVWVVVIPLVFPWKYWGVTP